MTYRFSSINGKNAQNIEMPNCIITGNSSSFTLKNNAIISYELDQNGDIIKDSEQDMESVQLTQYQLDIINIIKDQDGDSRDLDLDDLKKLDKEKLRKLIDDKIASKGIYSVKGIELTRRKVSVQLLDKNGNLKNIKIQFESGGFFKSIKNFFKSLFASETNNETKGVIEVGPLERVEEELDITQDVRKLQKAFDDDRVEIQPTKEYIAKGGEKPNVLANDYGVSLYRLKKANPNINLDWRLEAGQKIIIPPRVVVKDGASSSIKDIAENVGVSENYINDILFGIEGRKSEPDLKPYYDGVATSRNSKGVLTIGFGHTGRVRGTEMNSKNMNEIEITKDEAYQILAQDILNAKLDAIAYFGDDFLKAPQSIQDAIIDIVFNKGVELGLEGIERDPKGKIKSEKRDTSTINLKEDLANEDYVAAAQHVIFGTKNKGLKKRNVYRAIVALKDLSNRQRNKALTELEQYFCETKKLFGGNERDTLIKAWNNAKLGICSDFFSN